MRTPETRSLQNSYFRIYFTTVTLSLYQEAPPTITPPSHHHHTTTTSTPLSPPAHHYHHHTTPSPTHQHRHHQQQQHKIVRSLQLCLRFTRYLSVSSRKPYRIGNIVNAIFGAIFGTECCWSAPLLTVVRPVSDRFQDAATCSLILETSDMKPFAISEYYLTQNLKFQWENKAKDNYPGLTRSTLTASACVTLYIISKMHAFRMF